MNSSTELVEVDIPLGGSCVRVLLRPFEKFVEFLLEHFSVCLLGFELFPEYFIAPGAFPFEFGHFRGQVLNRPRPLRHGMGDYRAGLWINLKDRLAAGALDVEHTFGHRSILIEFSRGAGPATGPGRDVERKYGPLVGVYAR